MPEAPPAEEPAPAAVDEQAAEPADPSEQEEDEEQQTARLCAAALDRLGHAQLTVAVAEQKYKAALIINMLQDKLEMAASLIGRLGDELMETSERHDAWLGLEGDVEERNAIVAGLLKEARVADILGAVASESIEDLQVRQRAYDARHSA